MPQSTVANIMTKINAASSENEIETRSRKPKLIFRSIRLLLPNARKNRLESVRISTAKFNKFTENSFRESTVLRVLDTMEFEVM